MPNTRLRVPALLVFGECDDLNSLTNLLDTWRKLPAGSGPKVWHGLGHSLNQECPNDVAARQTRFVREKTRAITSAA